MQPRDALEKLGGIGSRSELLLLGCWDDVVDLALYYGRIHRVRRGWYALPEAPEDAVRAFRVGGRLACVSALAHHADSVTPPAEPIHVQVERGSSRLRLPSESVVVLHWSRRRLEGTRLAVSAAVAHRQSEVCRALA